MTIYEYCRDLQNGTMDVDVYDADLDAEGVCFSYTCDEVSDCYYQFLDLLAKKVTVVKDNGSSLVCDFSGFYKNYNDNIKEWYDKHGGTTGEFTGDEYYYNLTDITAALVAGNAPDTYYKELLEVLH